MMSSIGTVFQVLTPANEAVRFVQQCHKFRADLKRQLKVAYKVGSKQKQRKLMNSYFKNDMVKISSLSKAGVRLPNKVQWESEARLFDPFARSEETMEWWYEPKGNDSVRVVCDLAPRQKATSYMIADVLWAQMSPPTHIYNLKGRGRDKLITDLIEKLSQGYSHYRVYDVRDCFPSVSTDAIQTLKLPRRIKQHALNLDNVNSERNPERESHLVDSILNRGTIHSNHQLDGPRGLCQGSPASNLILAYLLQDMPQDMQDALYEFLFVDDLIVVARSEEILDRIDKRLQEFFCKPTVGPSKLIPKHAGHNGAFVYLGYEFRNNSITGEWALSLSQANWDKANKKYRAELVRLHDKFPHGIFASDPMKPTRDMLQGFPALSTPNDILMSIREGGLDQPEIEKAVQELRLNR
jgi:hypothetical protein